jgi:hypothetical protein
MGRPRQLMAVPVDPSELKSRIGASCGTEGYVGLDDPEASSKALRHLLVGGVHSVEDFAAEVTEAEGGDPLPAHQTTKIIGEVLTELD